MYEETTANAIRAEIEGEDREVTRILKLGAINALGLFPGTEATLHLFLEKLAAHQANMDNKCVCWICDVSRQALKEFM